MRFLLLPNSFILRVCLLSKKNGIFGYKRDQESRFSFSEESGWRMANSEKKLK